MVFLKVQSRDHCYFLLDISKILNIYSFADDTNIYYESNSLNDLEKTANKELKKLYLWYKPLKQHATIKINKKAIKEKESIKYLGVLVDISLSWKDQISNINKKISRAIGIMYKLRPFLPIKVMKKVYYSLI